MNGLLHTSMEHMRQWSMSERLLYIGASTSVVFAAGGLCVSAANAPDNICEVTPPPAHIAEAVDAAEDFWEDRDVDISDTKIQFITQEEAETGCTVSGMDKTALERGSSFFEIGHMDTVVLVDSRHIDLDIPSLAFLVVGHDEAHAANAQDPELRATLTESMEQELYADAMSGEFLAEAHPSTRISKIARFAARWGDTSTTEPDEEHGEGWQRSIAIHAGHEDWDFQAEDVQPIIDRAVA